MIRSLAAVPIALLALSCAHPESGPDVAAAPAPGTRTCITMSHITGRHAEDARTIRFDLIGGRGVVNRLGGDCPGLRQAANGFGTLAFDVHGGRLCRGDLVRVLDSSGARASYRTAIPCPLGDFHAVPRPPRGRR